MDLINYKNSLVSTLCTNHLLEEMNRQICTSEDRSVDPQIYNQVMNQYGDTRLDSGSVISSNSLMMGIIYTAFITPQQDFYNEVEALDITIDDDWGIELSGPERSYKLIDVARRLRNGFVHGNVEFADGYFSIWDKRPQRGCVFTIQDAEVVFKFTAREMSSIFITKWLLAIMPILNADVE